MSNIPLVIFLGILSTIQTHLAKALERQGIDVFRQIKAKLQKDGQHIQGELKKPIIYTIGIILNNTLFIWSTLAQPYGPPALFSSMFGVGLVFLLLYAALVLKEPITRLEIAGAAAILAGTLLIGIDNISQAGMDRHTMDLASMLVVLVVWLIISLVFIILTSRTGDLNLVALAYGLLAGSLGSLDPFFKGVGQNYGGQSSLLPSTSIGTAFFAASFIIGFIAFVVTQVGFSRRVRASLLVPAYNAAFISLPLLWQTFLLPGFHLSWLSIAGLFLILAGVVTMQLFKQPLYSRRLKNP